MIAAKGQVQEKPSASPLWIIYCDFPLLRAIHSVAYNPRFSFISNDKICRCSVRYITLNSVGNHWRGGFPQRNIWNNLVHHPLSSATPAPDYSTTDWVCWTMSGTGISWGDRKLDDGPDAWKQAGTNDEWERRALFLPSCSYQQNRATIFPAVGSVKRYHILCHDEIALYQQYLSLWHQ